MAKEIKIPQISEGVDTAIISEILVAKGDQIEEDQAVVSVETDKATAALALPCSDPAGTGRGTFHHGAPALADMALWRRTRLP